ncbi:hypothetical protein [Parendozoicomonas haliclonae]|uniref:Uncharacterized protein n=1 Tax=Parendozoicomonas haliclonae TaxID=1960125 RepID=A0A1X7AHT9_9GAMM|nr:hypothetical protein [Parendozoicomonas haliclonae]SMA42106.1 hypothetical protein EHSB41UT_01388 [Parendozoicomonas haliclonae]
MSTINISEIYETGVFKVLSVETREYASTKVSSTHFGGSNTPSISSSTTHHKTVDVWLEHLESGKEIKYEFSGYNLDMREGHLIFLAINTELKSIERIVNLNTDQVSYGDDNVNYAQGQGLALANNSSKNIVGGFMGLLAALTFASPYLGSFLLTMAVLYGLFTGWNTFTGTKIKDPRFGKSKLKLIALLPLSYLSTATIQDMPIASLILSTILFLAVLKINRDETRLAFQIQKEHSDALDEHIKAIVSKNKSNWLELAQKKSA